HISGGISSSLRYASTSNISNDLQRHYRFEELMELFDLSSVRVPQASTSNTFTPGRRDISQSSTSHPNVEWYRKQKSDERRELRSQKKLQRTRQLMQSAQPISMEKSEAPTGQPPIPGVIA